MHTTQFQEYKDYQQMAKEYKEQQQWNHHPAPTWNPKEFQERMHSYEEVEKNYKPKKKKIPTKAEIEAALKLEDELWSS